jgi:hypothetical protein
MWEIFAAAFLTAICFSSRQPSLANYLLSAQCAQQQQQQTLLLIANP